jgi:hypothetical protein
MKLALPICSGKAPATPEVRLTGEGRSPRPAASQLPGRSPVLPDRTGAEARSDRWQRRDLRRLAAGRLVDPKVASPPVRHETRRFRCRWHFTKPAAFASAKGKPAASAWRRLRQPPGLRFGGPSCLVGQKARFRSGCVRGFQPLPVDRLGHGLNLSSEPIRSKPNPPVDKEDNVHKRDWHGAASAAAPSPNRCREAPLAAAVPPA